MASFRANPVFQGGILQTSTKMSTQSGSINFDVKWDVSDAAMDLDASAVCFSSTGAVIDAAYFNNLSACNGGVVHSGDMKRAGGEGFNEQITVNLDKLDGVRAVMLMLSAYSGGNLSRCESAFVQISAGSTVLACQTVAGRDTGWSTGLFLGLLFRHPDSNEWYYKLMSCAVAGRHFSACLVNMRKIVDCVLDPACVGERTLSQDKCFEMEKGDQLTIPPNIRRLCIGLGWTGKGDSSIDLDASCIMLEDIDHDGDLDPVDVVYFGDKRKRGVYSSGDNMSGAGDGDDEQLHVDLNAVPATLGALAFIVQVYSSAYSFADIEESYVRLFNPSNNHVFAKFKLTEQLTKRGVVFCMLLRDHEDHNTWRLVSLGQECDGSTARNCVTNLWDGVWDGTVKYPEMFNYDSDCCCVVS